MITQYSLVDLYCNRGACVQHQQDDCNGLTSKAGHSVVQPGYVSCLFCSTLTPNLHTMLVKMQLRLWEAHKAYPGGLCQAQVGGILRGSEDEEV